LGRRAKFSLEEVGKNKKKREDSYNVGNKRRRLIKKKRNSKV